VITIYGKYTWSMDIQIYWALCLIMEQAQYCVWVNSINMIRSLSFCVSRYLYHDWKINLITTFLHRQILLSFSDDKHQQ